MAEQSSPERTLLKAVGTYLRATPAIELPSSLRRFREFRPQALWPHRDKIFESLKDDVLKARIKEWLDDSKTKIPKTEASALRAAVDGRPLPARSARPATKPDRTTADRQALERAKRDVKKAREETRKAKDLATKQASESRNRVAESDKELRAARTRIAELERDARAARRTIDKAAADRERDARRARKDTDRIVAERDEARRLLKEERKARRDLERELAKLKAAAKAPARPRPKASAAKPRKRRRLTAPKGLLADHPKALDAWLNERGVQLLVDGYNVAKSERGFKDGTLEEQRDRLVQVVEKVARRYKVTTIVVFDGNVVPPGVARRAKGRAQVEYSRPNEIADDHLIARLSELPPDPVVLVTSDRELQRRGERLGATVATSDQFLRLAR